MAVPILKLKGILLASIQVDLSDSDAIAFQAEVLRVAKETEAQGLLIDITAMDVVDSFMGRVINDTAHMAGMLGVRVVLCGMQPEVALVLTEMGRELVEVETALNLDQGFEKLLRMIKRRKA